MTRNYTDLELLEKVKSLPSFKGIPKGYWILGVQSREDLFNQFDDKFYFWHGDKFVLVGTGTTNAGKNGLKSYDEYGAKGVAVIKTNEWYYDVWKYGLHKGKVEALRQVKPFLISRDADKDEKVEEGASLFEICGINFHPNTYNLKDETIRTTIGGWSLGCQVMNNIQLYKQIIEKTKDQNAVTYCLLKEF
jgi:hypothetical protein